MDAFKSIVLICTVTVNATGMDIVRLLERAFNNHLEMDLTGLLIFDGDRILYLLEGMEPYITTAYTKLLSDANFSDVEIAVERTTNSRCIEGWTNIAYAFGYNDPHSFGQAVRDIVSKLNSSDIAERVLDFYANSPFR